MDVSQTVPEDLYDILKSLPQQEYEHEVDFRAHVLPRLAVALGYHPEQLLYEARVPSGSGHSERADAAIAQRRTDRPLIVIETYMGRHDEKRESAIRLDQVRNYRQALGSAIGVALSPRRLSVVQEGAVREYDLALLQRGDADALKRLLGRPSKWTSLPFQPTLTPKRVSGRFVFEQHRYDELWTVTRQAKSKSEKGRTLEDLAAYLFGCMDCVQVKYRDLRTETSEIDLILQNVGAEVPTFFDEYGRYSLVECKNWGVAVGAKHVRDFAGKLKSTGTRLGILMSRNGVTGSRGSSDALGVIREAYVSEARLIVVITEDDLTAVQAGEDLYLLLEEKLEALRFNF